MDLVLLLLRALEAGEDAGGRAASDRRGRQPAGKIFGAARCDQPRPALGQAGRAVESPRPFAPIYGWFTEGFDSADLKDAKALLHALACEVDPMAGTIVIPS